MAERFTEYMLTLLAQIGGGRGGPENELVGAGLGGLLWAVLLIFALRRRREEQSPHETLLAWGFGFGLLSETLMFVDVSLEVSGLAPRALLYPYFPPLEHALQMVAITAVTAGFLRSALGARGGGPHFLRVGAAAATVLYFAIAVPWARRAVALPGASFETTWFAWAFHLGAAAVLVWSIALLTRIRGWTRTVLLGAVGCFLLDETLMFANLAAGEAYGETLGPIRNALHLAGISLLAYLYLRQLAEDRNSVVQDLQTVINLTTDERQRTEAILDSIGDAVSVQGPDFRVIYQNRVHRRRLGDHRGEICHQAYAGLASPCPGCPVVLAFADGGVHHIERPRVRADGRGEVVEVTASCLRDGAGRIVAGIEVARDVTERVIAAAELVRAKEVLERQNAELRKLDVMKDGLIRDVTHEFKTPVAKHAMQLEILRRIVRELGIENETRRVLDVMASSITRQQRMIKNILDLARLEAGGRRYSIAPLRLDEVVAEVLEDSAWALESHAVSVSMEGPPLVLSSDREMLHCLFSNLIDNAIKYRSTGAAPRIAIAVTAQDGQVVVRVTDNGVGFDAGQLDHAFERFWQVSASVEGCGVGLTICRMIVEDLGGGIAIASEGLGLGTTVTVRLPGDGSPPLSRRPSIAEREEIRKRPARQPPPHPGHAPVRRSAQQPDR